jgi:hypothetical protein
VVARLVVAPLDVIKLRLQVGSASASPPLHQALLHLAQTEGVHGLFRGNSWALALWVSYGAIQFPIYEACKSRSPNTHLANGAIASMLATALTFPLDSIRTRIIAMGHPPAYPTTLSMLRAATHQESMSLTRVLFKGLPSSLSVVGPTMALTFDLHERLGAWLPTGLAGGLAGALAKTVTFPLDTVKRRLQSQGLDRVGMPAVPRYTSFVNCVEIIYAKEGWRAFFRGVWPAVVKTSLSTAVTFWVYDGVKNRL